MRSTTPLISALLTFSLTNALPHPEPGLLPPLTSILGGLGPKTTTTVKATSTAAALPTVETPGGQTINFTQVDAVPPAVIESVPFIGTSNIPAIQSISSIISIANAKVIALGIPFGLGGILGGLTGLLREKRDAFSLEDAHSLMKRDGDCSIQPAGTGPAVSPDTVSAFLGFSTFAQESENALTPDGYTEVFTNLQGSTQTTSYLGYITLDSYDTDSCAAFCNALDGCQGFNIYFERDPSKDPNALLCPNPTSITNIKCARWGVQVSNTTATNVGQGRDQFQVVITGSNGYNKAAPPPSQTGYVGPIELGGAMSAPLDPITSTDTYITYTYFPFGSDSSKGQIQYYDPEVCTAACNSTSTFDFQNNLGIDGRGGPALCNMVVAYVLSDADVPQGVYCAMYTESWDPVYATNVGQFRENSSGGEDFWSVSQAYAYINATYAAEYPTICATGGCAAGSFQGGNCGGWGAGTC